jgi:hypothetical protein
MVHGFHRRSSRPRAAADAALQVRPCAHPGDPGPAFHRRSMVCARRSATFGGSGNTRSRRSSAKAEWGWSPGWQGCPHSLRKGSPAHRDAHASQHRHRLRLRAHHGRCLLLRHGASGRCVETVMKGGPDAAADQAVVPESGNDRRYRARAAAPRLAEKHVHPIAGHVAEGTRHPPGGRVATIRC